MSHTIELRKVSKYYAGEDSVSMGFSRIDLNLDIGEFVAITGESGSGKSTLLNVISGLDTYEEGEMFVCGEDTTAYNTEDYEIYRKTYIGNIFQDFNLINSYTVYQNIEAVMLLSGKKKKECRDRILELIDLVGLSEYRRTKVSKLSGGQKQRVAIARALAKDAPIIVADEPTGNLDSASAVSVMETLAKVSGDKLVVIVTHNYEQAEPYVTRKLTMHDGRIIEDKRMGEDGEIEQEHVNPEDAYLEVASKDEAESDEPVREGRVARAGKDLIPEGGHAADEQRKMRKSSELRLGVRNTFNLPAKFILLFIVYLFVSTAVLSQYASTKNSMHENQLLGTNPYFVNTSSDRLIVKKADESVFSDVDFKTVENTKNIDRIVKNDIMLDAGTSFSLGDFYVEGPVMPIEEIDPTSLTYGHMPENDYEIVIKMDSTNDALIAIEGSGEEYIGQKVRFLDMNQTQAYDISEDISIAGIIIDYDFENSDVSDYGSNIYACEAVCRELLTSMMATDSNTEINYDGQKLSVDYERVVYSSPNVPEGKAYIFQDQTYYYSDEETEDEIAASLGRKLGVKVMTKYFESEGNFKVDKVITNENSKKLVNIPADEYDRYYNGIFVNPKDFNKLFDKGYYQISAYMDNEQNSEETLAALKEKGFTSLAIKDSLSDATDGYDTLVDLGTYGRLLLEFLILFLIAYAVIRLIMRSRNSYYSTLRILGATKGNTDTILRVELILMMIIAYGVDILFVVLVNKGVLQNLFEYDFKPVTKLLYYLTITDYCILGGILLLISLLIANRYSRHIFTRSAMKAFREEV